MTTYHKLDIIVLTKFNSTVCLFCMKVQSNVAITIFSEDKGNKGVESLKMEFKNFQREMQEQYLRGIV